MPAIPISRTQLRVLLVLVSAPIMAGAVVMALLASVRHGGWLWWTFVLAVAGALLFLGFAARGRPALMGVALFAGAAAVSGWAVWSAPDTGIRMLLGEGAPCGPTAAAWLSAMLAVVVGVATCLSHQEIGEVSARSWCALVAVAVFATGVVGTGTWLGARGLVSLRENAIAAGEVEHTLDPTEVPGQGGTGTGPARLRTLWQAPLAGQTVVAVPATQLVVAANGRGDQSGVTVYDARTGKQRWHFRTHFFNIGDSVAVSPWNHRMLVVTYSVAMLFDLDSGTELARVALPEPSAGPTLGSTHYRIIGPQPEEAFTPTRPQVELTGTVAHLAVTGHPGPTDVLAVNLLDGHVSTTAAGLPEHCRFREIRQSEYIGEYDEATWLLRDGIGCGTPRLTGMFRGRVQTDVPVTRGCAQGGCALVTAYGALSDVVIQTDTELLTFDFRGTLRAHTPITPDRRSVVLVDHPTPTLLPAGVTPRTNAVFARAGALLVHYRTTGAKSGELVMTDAATGRVLATSEGQDCAKPDGISVGMQVVLLSCGSRVLAFG